MGRDENPAIFDRGQQALPTLPGALRNLLSTPKLFLPDWLSHLGWFLSAQDCAGPRLWPQQFPGHTAWIQTAAAVAPASRWEEGEHPGPEGLSRLQSAHSSGFPEIFRSSKGNRAKG